MSKTIKLIGKLESIIRLKEDGQNRSNLQKSMEKLKIAKKESKGLKETVKYEKPKEKDKKVNSVKPCTLPRLKFQSVDGNVKFNALYDTGATHSFLSREIAEK